MTGVPLWGQWRRLTPRRQLMVVEAMLAVSLASALLRLLPFRRVARLASAPRDTQRSVNPERIARVRWAIEAVAPRMPFRAKCFERGLAAQLMLRRRGIASTLFYGARRNPEDGLTAHVWVRSREVDVIGCEAADGYALLARFPHA